MVAAVGLGDKPGGREMQFGRSRKLLRKAGPDRWTGTVDELGQPLSRRFEGGRLTHTTARSRNGLTGGVCHPEAAAACGFAVPDKRGRDLG